jgi:hypothetical protein
MLPRISRFRLCRAAFSGRQSFPPFFRLPLTPSSTADQVADEKTCTTWNMRYEKSLLAKSPLSTFLIAIEPCLSGVE